MGPLANARRITAMETFIGDATQHGATVRTGGNRIGNKGNFFEPTVLTDVPKEARVMNEEPFGPLAVISPFRALTMWSLRPTVCRTAWRPMPTRGRRRRRMPSRRRWRRA